MFTSNMRPSGHADAAGVSFEAVAIYVHWTLLFQAGRVVFYNLYHLILTINFIKEIVLWFHFCFFFLTATCGMACRILVPWLGVEPTSLALEAQSLNHWTTQGVLIAFILQMRKLRPREEQKLALSVLWCLYKVPCLEFLFGHILHQCVIRSVVSNSLRPHGL